MLGALARRLFGSANDRYIKSLQPLVDAINELEPELEKLSDAVLAERTAWLKGRLSPTALKDAPLRKILEVCYELQNEDEVPSYQNLMIRLDGPAVRSLAASLL